MFSFTREKGKIYFVFLTSSFGKLMNYHEHFDVIVIGGGHAGTEAAAATAVIVNRCSAAPEPAVKVTIDRPFIFLIRDIETGAVLFVGRVMNPST